MVKEEVWRRADDVGWQAIPDAERSLHYAAWTDDPAIGGVLVRYIPKGKVRVYIKDTLLKPYIRSQSADHERPLRIFRIDPTTRVEEEFIKPHGRLMSDGKVICWGKAGEWKHVLLALHERTYGFSERTAFGALLLRASGRFQDAAVRAMIGAAAERLFIERVVWLDS